MFTKSPRDTRGFIRVGEDDLAIQRSFYSAFKPTCPGVDTEMHRWSVCGCETLKSPERVRQDVQISIQLAALPGRDSCDEAGAAPAHPLIDILAHSAPVELAAWDDSMLDRWHAQTTLAAVTAVMGVIGVVSAVLLSLVIDIVTGL